MSARKSLVWNFEDNNFTWMDSSVILEDEGVYSLDDVVCMKYGFVPGWLVRWQDFTDKAVTWEELKNGTDPWSLLAERPARWGDLYQAGEEQNMYWLTAGSVWKADQQVDKTGAKEYYAERTGMDFDDVLGSTNYDYKHIRQLYPLLQSPSASTDPNTYTFQIGWANNLMDPPNFKDPITVDLLKTALYGKHKIDVRCTGRYMAMRWDFSLTDEIAMTGTDVDLEPAHGR